MKKLVTLFLCFFALSTAKASNYQFQYNGSQGGGGAATSSASCTADNVSGYCLYNSLNNVGLRFTLVYCFQDGKCGEVSTVNGKSIQSFDVWRTKLYTSANQFYYVGKSRLSANSATKHGDYGFYLQNEVLNGRTLIVKRNSNNDKYYNGYPDNVPQSDIRNMIGLMSKDQVTLEDLQIEAVSHGHVASDQCTQEKCYGYRIFIEPIFTWKRKINNTVQDWILTPTELAHLTSSEKDMSTKNDYRLYTTATSLTTNKYDAFVSVPELWTNATYGGHDYNTNIRAYLKGEYGSLGYALNIIDPMHDIAPSCADIEVYNPLYDLKNMTYDQLTKLGNLKFSSSGATVNSAWYRDNCSCQGMYQYYYEKTGKDLTKLNKNAINQLFQDGFFTNFNKTVYPPFTNITWTASDYFKSCPYTFGTDDHVSCDDVINFYKKDNLPNKSKAEILSFDFSKFNELYGTSWDGEMYIKNKCDYQELTCRPTFSNYVSGTLGSCYHGDTNYQDSANWEECIFTDSGSTMGDSYQDSNMTNNNIVAGNNPYCEIYCTETLDVNFNSNINIVKAGQKFTWDGNSITGTRTCKTKSIQWDTFTIQLEQANNDTREKWITYNLYVLANEAIRNASASGECCIGSCCSGVDEEGNPTDCDCCSTPTEYTANPSTVTFMDKSLSIPSWCGNDSPSYDEKTALASYHAAVTYANNLVKQMRNCGEEAEWKKNLYHFDPVVNIEYSDGYYTLPLTEMDKEVQYSSVTHDNDCKITTVYTLSCEGERCNKVAHNVLQCGKVSMSIGALATYSLPDNIFDAIVKATHISVNYSGLSQYANKDFTLNYIELGSNLPVAFRTENGFYGYLANRGKLLLTYQDLGHKIGQEQTHIDKYLQDNKTDVEFGKFECSFQVIDGLIKEDNKNNPIDVNVLYRPIDLNNPFPDIDGKGRITGSNWCFDGDCSNTNLLIQDVITHNRDTEDNPEAIYTKEPMYTFILKPSDIKNIRKYNKKNSYASYTGSLSNQYYDFVCDKGTGQTCISEYLTNLITMTEATGSCVNNRKDEFYSCR